MQSVEVLCACAHDLYPFIQEAAFTTPWTKREREIMDNVLGEQGKKFARVAQDVSSRSIADCIDRYYKVHLRDEFKPTWRKMARIKRAVDGKHKREEHSKVLAPVGKVAARPRHSAWPGGGLHAGTSGGLQWQASSTLRISAAVPVASMEGGVAMASLGASHQEISRQGRHHARRRCNAASENVQMATPVPFRHAGLRLGGDGAAVNTANMISRHMDQEAVQDVHVQAFSANGHLDTLQRANSAAHMLRAGLNPQINATSQQMAMVRARLDDISV